MTVYRVHRDDLTGAESWAPLPAARHTSCHRCHQPSGGRWYCRPCHRVMARRDWLPVLIVGVAAGMVPITLAVLMVLGVAR